MANKKNIWQRLLAVAKKYSQNKKVRAQFYSFVKTYFTVFIVIYLKGVVDGKSEGADIVLLNWPVIVSAGKWSVIAVIRNAYKLLTEK